MSGRKNVNLPHALIQNGNMSNNITSAAANVQYQDNVGIQVSWSGTTPLGSITVEGSVQGDLKTTQVWTALDFGNTLSVSGNTGSMLININQCPYEQLRINYVKSSGVGTLQAKLTSKAV